MVAQMLFCHMPTEHIIYRRKYERVQRWQMNKGKKVPISKINAAVEARNSSFGMKIRMLKSGRPIQDLNTFSLISEVCVRDCVRDVMLALALELNGSRNPVKSLQKRALFDTQRVRLLT
jgi:hypothetical protein